MCNELQRRLSLCFVAVFAIGVSWTAQAHLVTLDQPAALRVDKNTVYLRILVPITELVGFDDNGDGRISDGELAHHRANLGEQLTQSVELRVDGQLGATEYEDLELPTQGSGAEGFASQLVLLRIITWPHTVENLEVSIHLFRNALLSDTQLPLRATRDGQTELVVFSAQHPQASIFSSSWSTLMGFVKMGCAHILLGPDHLLFLLTVLLVGAGWRYWLSVVTSFTVAHSITLTMGALGVVNLQPAIVEPCIAASIVLMALDNLWRGTQALRGRVLVVFACGLLHGLGFASGLQELGLSSSYRFLSLLGFNLGVELGQGVFLSTVLGLATLIRLTPRFTLSERFLKAASAVTILLGTVMLVQRLPR